MIWEALMGGAVGGMIGGPLGMVTGAALAASWNVVHRHDAPPLQVDVSVTEGEDGLCVTGQLAREMDGCLAVLVAYTSEGERFRARVGRFADDRGQFQVCVRIQHNVIRCFVPHGVIETHGLKTVTMGLRVYEARRANALDLDGEERFVVPCAAESYASAQFWRPMLGLCMTVSRADGMVERTEVNVVRDRVAAGLQIPLAEMDLVTDILREEPQMSLVDTLDELMLRAPRIKPIDLLSALADVAHANGELHAAEVAIIFDVACSLGLSARQWAAMAPQLHMENVDPLAHYRRLLDITGQATAAEIDAAHQRQCRTYSPALAENMPVDVQQVAWRQTRALDRARQALLRALPVTPAVQAP